MAQFPLQKSYIHGAYVESIDSQKTYAQSNNPTVFQSINPANGEVLAHIQSATEEDVHRAVESACLGSLAWAAMTATQRSKILMEAAHILRTRNDELAYLESLDTGKPLSETLNVDIVTGVDVLEYYAGLASSLEGQCIPLRTTSFAYTRREPLGVVAGIGAWNYPIQIALWKSAPALAAGNAMVFKPSELTPMTTLKLAEIYTEAGVPAGVFNVLQGYGHEVGEWITAHPSIEKISFTGGIPTGKKVMARAGSSSLKDITMELGGKSPLIIFEDADLDTATDIAMSANFFSSGQVCTNGTRVFIPHSLKTEFERKLLKKMEHIIIGSPIDKKTNFGPLISMDHLKRVMKYIACGQEEGARLLYGGEQILHGELSKGAYLMPTIFTDCTDSMTITQEEIFGPVMSILTYSTEEEVIIRANDSIYGLASGLITQDLNRAHRVSHQLESGICWINTWGESPAQMPVGGYKQSGIGRENGIMTLESYTRIKSIQIEMGQFTPAF